jgi:diamine N-acetyltransferase
MIVRLKNEKSVLLRRLGDGDYHRLSEYLSELSPESKGRFGPHAFDEASIRVLYGQPDLYTGYIAQSFENEAIVAYSIIKTGYLEHDRFRLESYGLRLDPQTDVTFAPSVADAWQGCGLGAAMFRLILSDLKMRSVRRVILWGGVQAGNTHAMHYYQHLGFVNLGAFEYHGLNYDMALET